MNNTTNSNTTNSNNCFFCSKCFSTRYYSRKYEFERHLRNCQGPCPPCGQEEYISNAGHTLEQSNDTNLQPTSDDYDSLSSNSFSEGTSYNSDSSISNLSSSYVNVQNSRDDLSLQDLYISEPENDDDSDNSMENYNFMSNKSSTSKFYNYDEKSTSELMHASSQGIMSSNKSSKEDNSNRMTVSQLEAMSMEFFTTNSISIKLFNKFRNLIKLAQASTLSEDDECVLSYTNIIARLKSMECMSRHQYEKKFFTVNGHHFCIRVFPFLKNIVWLLSNPSLMKDAYFSYDETSTAYSEFNTGTWWRDAEEKMLVRVNLSGCSKVHVLIPIILFIDKTHCSVNGNLSAEPMLASIGNISMKNRKSNANAWFNLGFVPQRNLSQSEIDNLKKGKGCRSTHIATYHSALSAVLSEFLYYHNKDYTDDEGIEVYIHGMGNVQAHFELAMVIGDSLGNDQLCCHYQSYSMRVSRPMRMCFCSYDDLDNPDVLCSDVDAKKLDRIIETCIEHVNRDEGRVTEARNLAKRFSHDLHVPVFSLVKFGGNPNGIYGSTPVELLHALLLGIMKYALKCLFDYSIYSDTQQPFGKNDSKRIRNVRNVFLSAEFERRVRILSTKMRKQSVRDLPHSSFSHGVCKMSKLSGQEFVGLSVLTIAALPGCIKIDDTKDRLKVEKDYSEVLWLGVSLYECFNRVSIPKNDLVLLDKKVRHYIRRFVDVCGEQRNIQSSVGTKLQKLHSLIHVTFDVQKYGSAGNFFGGHLESMLKTFVKKPSKRTRGISGDMFLNDICNRWSEFQMVKDYNNMIGEINDIHTNDSTSDSAPTQKSTHKFQPGTKKVRFQFVFLNGKWNTRYSCDSSFYVEDKIFHPFFDLKKQDLDCITKWLTQSVEKENGVYPRVDCYYEMIAKEDSFNDERNLSKYRCSPSFISGEWFDWLLVEFENTNDDNHTGDVPSQLYLCMMLRYEGHDSTSDDLYLLVRSLSEINTPTYPLLSCFGYDFAFNQRSYVIHCETSYRGPILVLPAVELDMENGKHHISSRRVNHLSNLSRNQFFIAIPPRKHWHSIGWESMEI